MKTVLRSVVVMSFLGAVFPVFTHADIVQATADQLSVATDTTMFQPIGGGYSGVITGISAQEQIGTAVPTGFPAILVVGYNTSDYSGGQVSACAVYQQDAVGTVSWNDVAPVPLSNPTDCDMQPGTYYAVEFDNPNYGSIQVYGASSNVYPFFRISDPSSGGFDSNVVNAYFVLSGSFTGTPGAIDWNDIYTPLVYSTSSAAIIASSTLWGAFASTTQLAYVCNTGDFVLDTGCDLVAYLLVPNPQLLSGVSAIPANIGSRAPFSLITSVLSLVTTFVSNVATSTPVTATWHYSDGPASSTIEVFDSSSSIADFPLLVTVQNYAGDMIYVGWAVSVLFLIYRLV